MEGLACRNRRPPLLVSRRGQESFRILLRRARRMLRVPFQENGLRGDRLMERFDSLREIPAGCARKRRVRRRQISGASCRRLFRGLRMFLPRLWVNRMERRCQKWERSERDEDWIPGGLRNGRQRQTIRGDRRRNADVHRRSWVHFHVSRFFPVQGGPSDALTTP
jgi:hypothetical protein